MFGSRCLHCLRSANKMYYFGHTFNSQLLNIVRINQHIPWLNQKLAFCTKARVPPDVLKSKANEFSGTKSTLFESEPVQAILKRMTSMDLKKVFDQRKEDLSKPSYKLLDSEGIKVEEEKIKQEAVKRLKMPEVRSMRKPINIMISHDPELIHNDEDGANYVFTDISTSEDFRTRAVLIRENATGILREGNWDERDRMDFMYWPKEGQTYDLAPMLQEKHLPSVLDRLRHEHVLDFINIQCEVDTPDYIRVTHSVYEDIANREAFKILKSTRYYGGMVFYYVTNNKTSHIFSSFIRNGLFDDAADILRLHSLIYQDSHYVDNISNEHIIQHYITQNNLTDLQQYLNTDEHSVSQV